MAARDGKVRSFLRLLRRPWWRRGAGDAVGVIGERWPHEIPLFRAAEAGDVRTLKQLLAEGADRDERDVQGRTALMVAASPCVVALLLDRGADVHAVDATGRDAFDFALERMGDADSADAAMPAVIDAFIAAGLSIERADDDGYTRLIAASFARNTSAVGALLARGADAQARTRHGETALHAVCWQGEGDSDANDATERIIRAVVAAGIDSCGSDDNGNMPLHDAAGGDWANETAVRTLLEFGAPVDAVNRSGATPLYLAACGGDVECIRVLLAAGADPRRACHDGATALDAARDHLATWDTIVTDGCPEVDTILEEVRVEVASRLQKDLGEGAEAALSSIPGVHDVAERHRKARDAAREAHAMLERAVRIRDERGDMMSGHGD